MLYFVFGVSCVYDKALLGPIILSLYEQQVVFRCVSRT